MNKKKEEKKINISHDNNISRTKKIPKIIDAIPFVVKNARLILLKSYGLISLC